MKKNAPRGCALVREEYVAVGNRTRRKSFASETLYERQSDFIIDIVVGI